MSCGCNKTRKMGMKKVNVFDDGGNTAGCVDCVELHLVSARNIIKDAIRGRVDRYKIVWHLVSAANKTPKSNRNLFEALLDARRKFQRDGVIPDWDYLIQLLSRQV